MRIQSSDPIKGFSHLQCVIRLAGIIGMIQALLWLGLSIIGITAFACVFDRAAADDLTIGAVTQHTFYHMYFGDCDSNPGIDFAIIDNIPLKITDTQVNTWVWVYFALHIVWFFSSITLIPKYNKSRLVLLNTLLVVWVIITLAISAIDLALGILFGMDYGEINSMAYKNAFNFDPGLSSLLLAGMTSAISMMIIALRGFVLWLLNVGLLCYLFVHVFVISKAATNLIGHDNEGFISETQSDIILRQPIDAYSKPSGNDEKVKDSNGTLEIQLNVEPLKRATAMSVDSLLQRHYQRYPPGNDTKDENNSPSKKNGYAVLAETNTFKPYPNVPDPDYSPQLSRSNMSVQNQTNRPLKSALRNSRFQ